jgi:hypothetical protein
MFAQLTPNPGLLVATERRDWIDDVVAVDPNRSGLQPSRNFMCAADVIGPDRGSEPIGRIVALQHCVVLIFERNHGHDGTEDLLTRNLHGVLHVGENGGIDEEALAVVNVAARRQLGAFLFPDIQIAFDPIELIFGKLEVRQSSWDREDRPLLLWRCNA